MTAEVRARTHSFGTIGAGAFLWSALLLPWGLLIFHLHTFWTLAPDYQYGWLVAPLGLYLLFRRWMNIEVTSADRRGANALAAAFAALILPIWWVRAAVPDWSVINYALAIAVIAYTVALVACRADWRTAWALAFPIAFILCAVPWPQRAENAIIQTLTKFVAAGTVETLQWMGIGAIRRGNLIALGTGTIGISEACSGIRSLQSMLVAALALGEIYMLKIPRRLGLLAAGTAMALVLNLFRNVVLALVAASSGVMAVEKWHDRAGWAELLVSLPLLFLIARLWCTRQEPATTGSRHLRPLPLWSAVTLTIWFCAVAGGVEWWYQAHEPAGSVARQMEVHWPVEMSKFNYTPMDDRTLDILLCSDAQAGSWREADGTRWHLTFLSWAAGRTSAQSARLHRPEVCFQATGAEFFGKRPLQPVAIPGGTLFFEPLEFRADNESIYVFFSLYEVNQDNPKEPYQSRWERVHRAFLGQRNQGQQTAELSLRGFPSYESALQAAIRKLPDLLALRSANSK